MSEISSNYFFNFTCKLDYLVETIEHSAFSPRYNCEDFSYIHSSFGIIKNIFILMKSFCDIPFSHLMQKHIETYGSYGIGLKKDWGIKNNLTPVHYIPVLNGDAWYPSNLSSLYSLAFHNNNEISIGDLITNYFIYTKPYEKGGTIFYEEREWRYIPSLDNIKKIGNEDLRIRHYFILPNQDFDSLDDLKDNSNNLKNNEYVRLKFDLNDVKYVIVEKDNEIDKIKKMVNGNINIVIRTVPEVLKTQ